MKAKTRRQRFRELRVVVSKGLNASIAKLAQEYLTDFPRHGLVWIDYGNALANLGKYKEARTALLRAVKNVPAEHIDIPYYYLGRLYKNAGNHRRAVEWYKKASEVAPERGDYFIVLGVAYISLEKTSEAQACFARAIECKEGMIEEAYYNLGVILAGQRKYKNALTCFEKALQLDPKYKLAKQALVDMKTALLIKGTANNLSKTRSRKASSLLL
jgi:tetratricopeptide (TPR) repeat protein